MYATVHEFRRSVADETPGWAAALNEALHGTATGTATGTPPTGTCTLVQLAGPVGSVVAFWPTDEAAAAAADRRTPAGPVWLDATAYAVIDTSIGTAAGRPPEFAQLTCFDRPLSRAEADAAERAGHERLWPAVQDVPGLVSVHVLRSADRRMVVLALSTGVETHEEVQRAIFATELLPWEDPALLREPDRVHIDRVVDARLPEPAGAAS